MKFRLKRPCAHCPFRPEIRGVLRRSRAEDIARALAHEDQSFSCHKTVDYEGIDQGCEDTSGRDFCAGALLVMQSEELLLDNALTRFAIIFGMLDPGELRGSAYPDFAAFVEASCDVEG